MNRYILTIEGYKIKPRIYANSDKEAARKFSKENVLNIEKDTDTTYLNYISEIKARSQMVKQQEIKNNDVREIYQCQLDDGELIIRLYLDKDDNTYFDIAEYKWFSKDSLTYPIGFTYSSPEEVWDSFFSPFLTCEIPIEESFQRATGEIAADPLPRATVDRKRFNDVATEIGDSIEDGNDKMAIAVFVNELDEKLFGGAK